MKMHDFIFDVLQYLILIVMSIQSIFSFTELPQCYTEWLISNSSWPGQGQHLIDNPQCWSENFPNIPEKHSRWNTSFLNKFFYESCTPMQVMLLDFFQIFSEQIFIRQLWTTIIMYLSFLVLKISLLETECEKSDQKLNGKSNIQLLEDTMTSLWKFLLSLDCYTGLLLSITIKL